MLCVTISTNRNTFNERITFMIIQDIQLYQQTTPLKTPFKTALRRVDVLESLIVTVTADNGFIGYGAASPTAAVTGETTPSLLSAIRDYIAPAILEKQLSEALLSAIEGSIAHNTTAKAAVEMAIYDLLAQEANLSLTQYLGGDNESYLKNDITISMNSHAEMSKDVKNSLEKGITIFKIKLGGSIREDIARIDAIASVCDKSILRLDANQAWTLDTAKEILLHCTKKGYSIELIEQPFKYFDLESMKQLKNLHTIPILADESVFDSHDAKRVISAGCADYINIKLAKCGGITEAITINTIAEKAGINCLMGCMLESPIGIIAAAHFAAAFKNITMYDLDAVTLLQYNPIVSSTIFTPDGIYVNSNRFGLGITDIGDAVRMD